MKKIVNPAPIQMSIQNLKGEDVILTAKILTAKDFDEVFDTKDNEKKAGQLILERMVKYFGNNIEFYNQFDIRIIKAVLDEYNKQMTNPT